MFQKLAGIHEPVGASIFKSMLHYSATTIPLTDFIGLGLGLVFEFAFQIASDAAQGYEYDSNTIHPYIGSAMLAFEIIKNRQADYSTLDAMTIVLDNTWCGGIVHGTPINSWKTSIHQIIQSCYLITMSDNGMPSQFHCMASHSLNQARKNSKIVV